MHWKNQIHNPDRVHPVLVCSRSPLRYLDKRLILSIGRHNCDVMVEIWRVANLQSRALKAGQPTASPTGSGSGPVPGTNGKASMDSYDSL